MFRIVRFLPKLMLGSRQSTSQESITFKLRLNWMTLLRRIVVTTRVLLLVPASFHLSWSYSSLLQPEWYVVFVHHMISFVPLPYCIHLHMISANAYTLSRVSLLQYRSNYHLGWGFSLGRAWLLELSLLVSVKCLMFISSTPSPTRTMDTSFYSSSSWLG